MGHIALMKRPMTLAFICAAIFATSGLAAVEKDREQRRWAFVIHSMTHILLHEVAHALIHQFELPVIGQEEDAADAFATLAIVENFESPVEILVDSAQGMLADHRRAEQDGALDFYGEHDLDAQRAYRIICHAFGLERRAFRDVAKQFDFDRERLQSCQDESDLMADSWDRLLEKHRRTDDDALSKITVQFNPKGLSKQARRQIERAGIIEDIASYLEQEFAWPRTITLRFERCDEPNAFYDLDDRSITFCHEFIKELYAMSDSIVRR